MCVCVCVCVELKLQLEKLEISEEQHSYSRANITQTLCPDQTQKLCSGDIQVEEKEPIEILDTLELENMHEDALEENDTFQGTLERILVELNSLKYMREKIRELQEVTKEKSQPTECTVITDQVMEKLKSFVIASLSMFTFKDALEAKRM